MSNTYKYPKADHTVDIVVFGLDAVEGILKAMLVRRGQRKEPFYDHWALPGGFISMQEGLEEAARRVLGKETRVTLSYLEQLCTFGRPDRDPRGRVISTAYLALVRPESVTLQPTEHVSEARWFPTQELPPLAFDHAEILATGLTRLRSKVSWQPVGLELLGEAFTLSELQRVYEIILGHGLDKRNFRRKVLAFDILRETGEQRVHQGRPAKLYRFDEEAYLKLLEEGVEFEVRVGSRG